MTQVPSNGESELLLLRKYRLNAIASCDFAKARAIDMQMQKIQADLESHNYSQFKQENEMEYERVKECVKSSASEEFSRAYQQVYETRSVFQRRQATLLQEHSMQMAEVANDYAKDLEVQTLRQVPDSEYLRKQAQVKAKYGDYDGAETLFGISQATRETTVQQREEEIHTLYQRIQEHLQKRHTDELMLNNQKRRQVFIEIRTQYNAAVERMKKILTKSSIKLNVPQNIEEEAKMFQELIIETEDEANVGLTSSANSSPKNSPGKNSPSQLQQQKQTSPIQSRSPNANISFQDTNQQQQQQQQQTVSSRNAYRSPLSPRPVVSPKSRKSLNSGSPGSPANRRAAAASPGTMKPY